MFDEILLFKVKDGDLKVI